LNDRRDAVWRLACLFRFSTRLKVPVLPRAREARPCR
jgi:hypothetical protein